jgi:cellulose synthase (UDP-forming)
VGEKLTYAYVDVGEEIYVACKNILGKFKNVFGAEPVIVTRHDADGAPTVWEGVATVLNEHGMRMLLDESDDLALGDHVEVSLDTGDYRADVRGAVVGLVRSRGGTAFVHTVEILDFGTSELEYLQILYDRVPSLPQALRLELGALGHLWRNVAFRMARTVR